MYASIGKQAQTKISVTIGVIQHGATLGQNLFALTHLSG